jgi:hypothetical protein
VVEHRNQTVVGMARSMMKAKNMLSHFWGEGVTTAVYLLNRAHTRSIDGMTPYEAWHGKKPSVEHLRVFGCVVHVKSARPFLRKLDDRSTPMVFIGYEPGSKAYRVYDPATRRVHVTRDTVFDEGASWSWEQGSEAPDEASREFAVEYTVTSVPAQVVGEDLAEKTTENSAAAGEAEGSSPMSAPGATTPPSGQSTPPATFATPPSSTDPDLLDAEDDPDEPHRYRRVTDLIGSHDHAAQLFLILAEEPGSVEEARRDPCWRRAMDMEMQSIKENSTWDLVDLP